MPLGAPSRSPRRCGSAPRPSTRSRGCSRARTVTAVGDEGGFAPDLPSNEEAIELHPRGRSRRPATRPATTSPSRWTRPPTSSSSDGRYTLAGEPRPRRSSEMVDYWRSCVDHYPIVSIEDGMAEDDWDGWRELTSALGDRVQLVGDDLFVTNAKRLAAGDRSRASPTRSWSRSTRSARSPRRSTPSAGARHGYTAVMSHRSGETEDTTIADLAVATNCGQIKTGAPARSDRVAKYNQLLRIEEELGERRPATRAGGAFARLGEGRARSGERRDRFAGRRSSARSDPLRRPPFVEQLAWRGMNAARLNFSHGEHDEHLARLSLCAVRRRWSAGRWPWSPTSRGPRSGSDGSLAETRARTRRRVCILRRRRRRQTSVSSHL